MVLFLLTLLLPKHFSKYFNCVFLKLCFFFSTVFFLAIKEEMHFLIMWYSFAFRARRLRRARRWLWLMPIQNLRKRLPTWKSLNRSLARYLLMYYFYSMNAADLSNSYCSISILMWIFHANEIYHALFNYDTTALFIVFLNYLFVFVVVVTQSYGGMPKFWNILFYHIYFHAHVFIATITFYLVYIFVWVSIFKHRHLVDGARYV